MRGPPVAVALLLAGAPAAAEDPASPPPGAPPGVPVMPTGKTATEGPAEPDPLRAGMRGWYTFPGVFYTPETRLGGALVFGIHFGVEEGLATSNAELITYYTQNHQAAAQVRATLCPSRPLLVDVHGEASYFPAPFYGVGPGAPASAEEWYTNRYVDLRVDSGWTISGALRGGVRLHLRREVGVTREEGGALAQGDLPGSGDWGAVGVGPVFTWDGRDDRFQPSSGGYVNAAYAYYPSSLAAGVDAFGRAQLDVRWFFSPLARNTLGFQVMLEGAHGDVPVTVLPNIGGNDTLRGYVDGRYRDDLGYSAQVEWRFPIAGRFRGTVFAGAGGVGHDLAGVTSHAPRPAGGLGLRFRLTSTGAYLRGDVAYGADGVQIYFLTMEAF